MELYEHELRSQVRFNLYLNVLCHSRGYLFLIEIDQYNINLLFYFWNKFTFFKHDIL